MLKRGKLLFLFLVVEVMILISGCTNNNQGNNFEKLIANIHQDGKFIFEDLTWLMDRSKIMELEDLSEDNEQQGRLDLLSKPIESFDLDNGSLDKRVIYIFSENKKDTQFVSGEYLIHTSDKDLIVAFSKKLKTYLSESLTDPTGNDLSILDQASEASDSLKSVWWDGTDDSRLTVSIGTTKNEDEETEYLVKIKTSAPSPK